MVDARVGVINGVRENLWRSIKSKIALKRREGSIAYEREGKRERKEKVGEKS